MKVKEDIMRKKGVNKKTLLSSKKKKNLKEEKNVKTTPSVNKISKYFVRKHEDNQTLKTTSVKEMIGNLEDRKPALLSEKTEGIGNSKVMKLKKMYDDNNIMKKTFNNLPTKNDNNIQKKIMIYQEASDNSDSCLFGSGRCAKHHTRLVREVTKKRVSVVTKEGSLGWKMCEGTILVCPAVRRTEAERGDTVQPDIMLSANKRARICENVKEPIAYITA